jgi:alkylated DNA repair dioxygenase AlkB
MNFSQLSDDQMFIQLGPLILDSNQQLEWILNDQQNQWFCCILRKSISLYDTQLIYNVCQRDCTIRYENSRFGKVYLQPRTQCVYADHTVSSQKYSNANIPSIPWNPLILRVKNFITKDGFFPNSCLINGYVNGREDYVSWHRDKEMRDGRNMVCTVSIGGTRKFVFRKYKDEGVKVETFLNNGDIVYFWGNTNRDWEHSIPKPLVAEDSNPRYSLTFRKIDEF